jgi:hypothetical protein
MSKERVSYIKDQINIKNIQINSQMEDSFENPTN